MAHFKSSYTCRPNTPSTTDVLTPELPLDPSARVREGHSHAVVHTIKKALQFLALAIVLSPTVTTALPIGWTTGTVNGANVVIDSAGNQWLSPTITTSQTFNDALASDWVTTFGFQAVTLTQFHGLLAAYGLPPSTDMTGDGYISNCCDGELLFPLGGAAAGFFGDFGANLHDPSAYYGPEDHSYGFLASSETYPLVLVGQVRFLNRNGDAAGGAGSYVQTDGVSEYVGTWLIAPSANVPEPTSLALLSLGLLGVAIGRRRSARQILPATL